MGRRIGYAPPPQFGAFIGLGSLYFVIVVSDASLPQAEKIVAAVKGLYGG